MSHCWCDLSCLSNIVRRRPPNNRNPTAPEVTYFKPWLLEEIRLVDPFIILLAGTYVSMTQIRIIVLFVIRHSVVL